MRIIAEIGPIEFNARIELLERLERVGLSFKESSKLEKARYTKFFSQKIDVNRWDDMAELSQAMIDLYNSPEFTLLRKQVASVLNNESSKTEDSSDLVAKRALNESNIHIQHAFKNWMGLKNIPETHYRVSSKNLSFKIPLFDQYKEKLGETRIKWWWDNGPLLIWMEIRSDSLYFTLEVGPIESDKRVLLMESMREKGIRFTKKGLTPEAKYNRIHSETKSIEGLDDIGLLNTFNSFYDNNELQDILQKLQQIYDDTVISID